MDLVAAWLKTNTPTKCPDCYNTPDTMSEYEKAKQFKDKHAKRKGSKARKVLDSKAFEKESRVLCSIQ